MLPTISDTNAHYSWQLDLEGRFTYISPAYEKLSGYMAQEILEANFLDIIPDFEKKAVEDIFAQAKAGAYVHLCDIYLARKDRTLVPVEISALPVMDGDKVVGVQGITRDISRQKETAQKLEESEERYRKLFENAYDALLIIKAEKIVECNQRACDLFAAKSRDAIIGTPIWELATASAGQMETKAWQRLWKANYEMALAGKPINFNYRFNTLNNSPVEIEVFLNCLNINDQVYVQAILHDVTLPRRLQSEKEKTIECLRRVNMARTKTDLAAVATGFIRDWLNLDAAGVRLQEGGDYPYYETTGFSHEFVRCENYICSRDKAESPICDELGNPFLDCMCGAVISSRTDPEKPFFTPFGSFWTNSTSKLLAVTTEDDRMGRTRNRCRGEGYESVALIPLRTNDKTYGLVQLNHFNKGAFSPSLISTLERIADNIAIALEKLFIRDDLKKALKEKEVLLQEIHHRVKNNMQIIHSLLNLQARKEDDPRVVDALRDSQARVSAMALAHESIYQSESLDEINLFYYINALTSNLSRTWFSPGKSPILKINIPNDIKVALKKAIPCGLVINELITNALKHAFPTGETGEISIEAQSHENGSLYMIVRDNGVGLPEGFNWREGKRLGLNLVKNLVEQQMDGRIELDRKGGTTFVITS